MRCGSCGGEVEASNVFPGGSVRCACGSLVPVERSSAVPASSGPYREPSGREPAPSQPGAEPRALCPRCGKGLRASSDPSEPRFSCPSCGGAFYAHATFADLLTAERAKRDEGAPAPEVRARPSGPESSVRYLRCPVCDQPMSRLNFGKRSGVIVDACKADGSWLDAGELDRILEFVRAGGLEAAEKPSGGAVAEPPLIGEAAAMARSAQSLLKEEAMLQDRAIEEATDLAYLLFGARRRWWR